MPKRKAAEALEPASRVYLPHSIDLHCQPTLDPRQVTLCQSGHCSHCPTCLQCQSTRDLKWRYDLVFGKPSANRDDELHIAYERLCTAEEEKVALEAKVKDLEAARNSLREDSDQSSDEVDDAGEDADSVKLEPNRDSTYQSMGEEDGTTGSAEAEFGDSENEMIVKSEDGDGEDGAASDADRKREQPAIQYYDGNEALQRSDTAAFEDNSDDIKSEIVVKHPSRSPQNDDSHDGSLQTDVDEIRDTLTKTQTHRKGFVVVSRAEQQSALRTLRGLQRTKRQSFPRDAKLRAPRLSVEQNTVPGPWTAEEDDMVREGMSNRYASQEIKRKYPIDRTANAIRHRMARFRGPGLQRSGSS